MKIRPKTRRRLFILLTGILALGVAVAGGVAFRVHSVRQRAALAREAGMAALTAGDYATALDKLGIYLSRNQTDVDILYQYAQARQQVEEPGGKHLAEAISLYKRVLELKPDHSEARHKLLNLYVQVGFGTETLAAAELILAKDPADAPALRAKAAALVRLRRLDEALKVASAWGKMAPLDLEAHLTIVQIMLKNKLPPQKILDYVDATARAHPGDARFDLLRSVVYQMTDDRKKAAETVKLLLLRPLVDTVYTHYLVTQLDALGLFDDADKVLARAAQSSSDREMTRAWISRQLQANRFQEVVDLTKSLDPRAATSPVDLLGLRAWALIHVERRDEAAQLATALEERGRTDPPAARWAAVVRQVMLEPAPDAIRSARVLNDALTGSPNNPVLWLLLGDAYAGASARDKAMEAWTRAARQAPAWGMPLVRITQQLLAGGRTAQALETAEAAHLRAPDDVDALVTLALARAAAIPEDSAAIEAPKVLQLIAQIKQRFPTDNRLLTLEVSLLVRIQHRDAAIQLIHQVLSQAEAPKESVLVALAELSANLGLGVEEACLDRAQKAYGLTPQIAFTRAVWLYNAKRPADGLALMDKARSAHPATDQPWRMAWARYLDLVSDPRAKDEWINLGDQNPSDVHVQWAAISTAAVQADHAFIGRTIDRLCALLGEDSLTLRFIRARWLLEGQSTEKDTTQASLLLSEISRGSPDLLAPRLLLVAADEKLGNLPAAIEQLTAVANLKPDAAAINLELAHLLQIQGEFARAREYIDRVLRSKQSTDEDLRRAASMLALEGDYDHALSLAEQLRANDPQQRPTLMLAALYRQLNQPAKAEDTLRKLLVKPDAPILQFAADFFASTGRKDQAEKALAQLDSLTLAPGSKELIRAAYAVRHGTPAQALDLFQQATKQAPQIPAVWRQLIGYSLSIGQTDAALAAAATAGKQFPDQNAFTLLTQHAALIKAANQSPAARPLLMGLLSSSADQQPVFDALQVLADAAAHQEPIKQTIVKLRQLADRNPRVMGLQTLVLQFYMTTGQPEEALAIATRAVQSFPTAVEPVRLATGVLEASGRWDEALSIAKEWRRRSATEPQDADLAIAGAEIQLGNSSAALQQLQLYVEQAKAEPDKYIGVIVLYAQALLVAHHPDQVEELLKPLLTRSPQWRNLWLSLTVRGATDAKHAAAWLDLAAKAVPNQDPTELTAVAQAWMAVGVRWDNKQFDQTGRQLLQALAAAPKAPTQTVLAWAIACEVSGDLPNAEAAYRRVLDLDPKQHVAWNNLAMVLFHRDAYAEALPMASKAIELAPTAAPYFDTRATIQSRLKDPTAALASINEARRLDPRNLEWRISKTTILLDSSQTQAAKKEFQEIAAALPAASHIPEALRQRIESLRSKLQ